MSYTFSYGSKPKDAKNWREKMLIEVGSQIDAARTHFLGKLPYAAYKRVLQVSSAHVYLTYPFVLSWSCLEAMVSGCMVIGSDTAPVREVLRDDVNGVLVQLGDERRLKGPILDGLARQREGMRAEAQRMVRSGFSRDSGVATFLNAVAPWAREFLVHPIDQGVVSASTHQERRSHSAAAGRKRV